MIERAREIRGVSVQGDLGTEAWGTWRSRLDMGSGGGRQAEDRAQAKTAGWRAAGSAGARWAVREAMLVRCAWTPVRDPASARTEMAVGSPSTGGT